jgi:hypothetical protein
MNFKEYLSERWKDPLNRHYLRNPSRSINRKDPTFVPKSHQMEIPPEVGQAALDIAKKAESGLWKITPLEATSIAQFY